MISVLCADDSPFLRKVLKDALQATGKIQVIGEAKNGKEAIEMVQSLKPDVLILDCEMPVMNGLEALRRIMDECPLPVFIFSSLAREGASVTLKALEYGAVDYLLKPTGGAHQIDMIIPQMVEKIEYIARRNKYRFGARPRPGSSAASTAAPAAAGSPAASVAPVASAPAAPAQPVNVSRRNVDLIAIGSSTGGVQAAVELVKRLPKQTKPIVWVQHMPATFTPSFAARLNSIGTVKVCEARNGQTLEANTCYIAPGGFQMRVRKNGSQTILNVGGLDKVNGFCPSCDVLFDSVAQFYSQNVIGVILTGMGDDGSRGLLRMKQKGAYVIGQDEESCVVYGMPKAAHQIGAVDLQLDLFAISDAIVRAGGGN